MPVSVLPNLTSRSDLPSKLNDHLILIVYSDMVSRGLVSVSDPEGALASVGDNS